MALKYNNQFQPSTPPAGLQPLDAVRRRNRSQLNQSVKLNKTIYGSRTTKEVIKRLLWDFDDPDGTEVVNYTFNFSGNISIVDFGDGTSQDSVTSGELITKSYS